MHVSSLTKPPCVMYSEMCIETTFCWCLCICVVCKIVMCSGVTMMYSVTFLSFLDLRVVQMTLCSLSPLTSCVQYPCNGVCPNAHGVNAQGANFAVLKFMDAPRLQYFSEFLHGFSLFVAHASFLFRLSFLISFHVNSCWLCSSRNE